MHAGSCAKRHLERGLPAHAEMPPRDTARSWGARARALARPEGPPAAIASRSGRRGGRGRTDPRPCSSPRPRPSAAGAQAGFTLLELIVVLLLLALVAGIAVPNLEGLYAGAVRSTERAYILDQFAGLGRRAMHRGQAFVVVGSGEGEASAAPPPPEGPGRAGGPGVAGRGSPRFALPPAARADHAPHVIDLPEGWEISFDAPLVFRANGVCLGAELTLRHRGEVDVRLRLEPPFCRVAADA